MLCQAQPQLVLYNYLRLSKTTMLDYLKQLSKTIADKCLKISSTTIFLKQLSTVSLVGNYQDNYDTAATPETKKKSVGFDPNII